MAANSLLIAAATGIRALLIFGLAVWLEPGELGLYGLVAATVSLTTYLYGLDFYTFTLRELSVGALGDARYRVRDQFMLFGAIYLVGGAALAVLLPLFGMRPELVILVMPLAAAQHAALELNRILIRIERAVAASIASLIRDGAWVPGCLLVQWLWGNLSVTDVLLFWTVGSIASVGYALWLLGRVLPAAEPRPVDRAWLARGARSGLRMLAGTLSLRALFTVDRMAVAVLAPPEVLGAYVFFTTVCISVNGFFETSVLPFFWPRLLEAANRRDATARRAAEQGLARVCLLGAGVGAVIMIAAGAILAKILPHPAYAQNLDLLRYVAAAYLCLTLANIPHYRLYAGQRDIAIVASNAAGFAAFLLVTALLALGGSTRIAVPIGLAVACSVLLAAKLVLARPAG